MPLTPPQTDPEQARPTGEESSPEAPVTFVPHDGNGAVSAQPVKIQTGRYGEMEAHELVHLLDSMEDERARGRFRESIYISAIFYLAVAWFLFYGPRVLWHAPKVKLASDVLRERRTMLIDPGAIPHPPAPRVVPPPRIDAKTLEKLREEAPKTPPAPKTPAPEPAKPSTASPAPAAATPPPPPVNNMPNAPAPQPAPAHTAPPVVAEAPAPQPSARPNFNTGSASDNMRALSRAVPPGNGLSGGMVSSPIPGGGGGSIGSGVEILSDTQGVDFSSWLRAFKRGTYAAWLPLLPEEIRPPLSKEGKTWILLTVLPDGSIGDIKLEASTHDDALNRAAWGSLTSQGKLPALPRDFHGSNLVLRVVYIVGKE